MKKIALSLFLVPIFSISCAKKDNKNNSPTEAPKEIEAPAKTPDVQQSPKPLDPEAPLPPHNPPEINPINIREKESILHFGSGKITLNNETSEFKIEPEIKGNFDYSNQVESGGIFDSTDYFNSKSSLFPNNKHSYIQIPNKIYFDPSKSIDGKGSDNKYHIDLQIWGTVGNSFYSRNYLFCYKSVEGKYSILDFAVDQNRYKDIGSCSDIANKIQSGEIKKLPISGEDFILLRVNGFRFDSYGDCTNNNTCRVFSNFNLVYYIEK